MGYIYKITHKESQKSYVGQSCVLDINERWRQHFKKHNNCRYLKHALTKYGNDAFTFSIICICFDKDLDKYEIEYITKYNTLTPHGYNIRLGGNKNGKHHEETKKRISESLKKLYSTPGYVHNKPSLGIPHTKETKEKISKAHAGRKMPVEIRERMCKLRVVLSSLDGIDLAMYACPTDCAIFLGVNKSTVIQVCNGMRRTCKGYKLRYMLKDDVPADVKISFGNPYLYPGAPSSLAIEKYVKTKPKKHIGSTTS